jgi:hypothetical protein
LHTPDELSATGRGRPSAADRGKAGVNLSRRTIETETHSAFPLSPDARVAAAREQTKVRRRIGAVPPHSSNVETLQALERDHIIAMLERTGGVIEGPNGAARLLGMKPGTVRHRLEEARHRPRPCVTLGTQRGSIDGLCALTGRSAADCRAWSARGGAPFVRITGSVSVWLREHFDLG